MSETKWYENFLKKFFHDPIDKPFDIPSHEQRANRYAQYFGISNIKKEDYDYSDMIASCMERSFLPSNQQKNFDEIRHPLSEEKLIYQINGNEIKNIEKAIEEISKSYKNLDDEKKSFLLWRNLIDEITEKINDPEFKKYIPILPADTRVPDHSIWEHIKITTAINAKIINNQNLQNNSLFLFSIGPVQSFISQARKAQDFYMGSFILSYLTFISIKQILEKYGLTSIIYPDLHKQPLMDWYLKNKTQMQIKNDQSKNINLPTIPNRFVAIIPETDEEKIKLLAKDIKDKINKEIENSKNEIFNELDIKFSELENIIKTQFSDFPQIYWVSVPWKIENNDININHLTDFFESNYLTKWKFLNQFIDQNGEHKSNIGFLYQLLYTTLEKSMGARKNIREFTQIKEEGRKCSICGERNVVFYRDEETPLLIKNNVDFFFRNKEKDSFIEIDKNKITYKIIGKKEGLCSICFWKRTFGIYLENKVDKNIFKDFSFPSTAEIACADFKEKVKDFEEFKNYEKKFFELTENNNSHIKINSLPKLNLKETLEGSWFYEDNLNSQKIKDELGIDISQEKIEGIKEILKNLQKKANKKPNTYYAVIYLDVDNMGKWLSGELLPSIENSYNSEIWNNLNNDFKTKLREYIGEIHTNRRENKLLTPAIHSAISAALRNYSIEFVRKIVEEEHLGKLIYAGGDDVLAFVNLKDLFDVMEKLRWAFSGNIKFENNEIKVDLDNNTGFVLKNDVYYLTMGKNATCSMGVVIAHHKEPLKIVIDKVFEMGKIAKENGRDGFAISLMKHSGEERIGSAKWKIDIESTIEIFKKLKKDMNSENEIYISDGFIKKFKMEFSRFKDELKSISEEIINKEITRLVKRSYNNQNKSSKEDSKKEEFIKSFTENAIKLFWRTTSGIDNFVNLFEIISFTNRGE